MSDPAKLLDALRKDLAREFEIEGFVGRGDFALVFRAVEKNGQRLVALKVVPPDAPTGLGERVRKEARVAANLSHANIVPIYSSGKAAGTDYYTMRYVEGCSLDQVIRGRGALKVPHVLTVLRSVVAGLAYAHDRRIIHRDVRGANVFIDQDGGIVLADPGIAKALDDKSMPDAVPGSAQFASPEQAQSQRVGHQADQYAIGVLAFQMLTGKLPFEASNTKDLLALHVSATPPDLRGARPDAPTGLAEVVAKALAKAPGDRYATTRDMLRAIEAVPLDDKEQEAALADLLEFARKAPKPKLVTKGFGDEEKEREKADKARQEEERRQAEEQRKAEEARLAAEKRQAEEKKKADEARLAEEKRKADEKRKAEEARLAEEKRQADERRKAEDREETERKRQAEAKRQAEEKRIAEERRQAEEARLAEERRVAEEKRKADEKRAAEERHAAEKKAYDERVAQEKRMQEEQRAAERKRIEEKRAEEERAAARRQEEERLAEEARREARRAEERRQAEERRREEEQRREEERQAEERRRAELKRQADERRAADQRAAERATAEKAAAELAAAEREVAERRAAAERKAAEEAAAAATSTPSFTKKKKKKKAARAEEAPPPPPPEPPPPPPPPPPPKVELPPIIVLPPLPPEEQLPAAAEAPRIFRSVGPPPTGFKKPPAPPPPPPAAEPPMFVHGTPTPDVPSGDMQIVFEHGTPAPDVAPAAPPPLPPPPPPRHEPPIAAFQPPPPVEPPPLRKSMEWSPADVPAIRPSGATRAPVEEPPPPVLAPRDPSLLRPRRTHLYIPVVPILTILVAAGAVVVGVIVAKSKLAERSRAAAVADSLRAVAAADSARRAAVPTVGWIQLVGDLPEDAILWLDTNQMNSRLFSATPGSHNVEVEADEFEPWERRVMVRLGDTIQVMVELNLRPQPESP